MPENEKTTIQISKESLAKLKEMAEYEFRSTSSQADWTIEKAYESFLAERAVKMAAGK